MTRRTKERRLIDLTMEHFAGMAEIVQHRVDPIIVATYASPKEIRTLRADITSAAKWLDKAAELRSRRPREQ
jgi:hypothetical protein